MNQEQKRKWIEALRSGRFNQGSSRLGGLVKRPNEDPFSIEEFCCLGVANEVLGLGFQGDQEYLCHRDINDTGSFTFLPKDVQTNLAELNDGTPEVPRFTFIEIADYIEKEIPCTE